MESAKWDLAPERANACWRLTRYCDLFKSGLGHMETEGSEGVDSVEKRRLRRAASRLRECYLTFLAGLAALPSLASFGAE